MVRLSHLATGFLTAGIGRPSAMRYKQSPSSVTVYSARPTKRGHEADRSQSQIFVENQDFILPHLYSTPALGGGFPSEYCHDVWYRKTRMTWLSDGEQPRVVLQYTRNALAVILGKKAQRSKRVALVVFNTNLYCISRVGHDVLNCDQCTPVIL